MVLKTNKDLLEIKGTFNQRVAIDELGNKNGMEFLSEGAELFGYTYYADNKIIYIHDDNSFMRCQMNRSYTITTPMRYQQLYQHLK
nr:hypothetical protein [Staphylococcus warneri]